MVLGLQIYLIEHYTKPGDVILDPMAGSGTALTAITYDRNVICVELEQKFVRMAVHNRDKLKRRGRKLFCGMGEAVILWGDSREILTTREHPYEDLWLKYPKLDIASVKSVRRKCRLKLKEGRNLSGVLADVICTSPPYAQSETMQDKEWFNNHKKEFGGGGTAGEYAPSPSNIGNLPYGSIDAVVTSPPYADQDSFSRRQGKSFQYTGKHRTSEGHCELKQKITGTSEGQIGNLPYKADAVITSPPYEAQGFKCDENPANVLKREAKRREKFPMRPATIPGRYGDSQANIGNLKSDNYLEAMFSVYQNCHAVLKENGLLILVVKNFIRDKKIVRLDTDTIKLCEKAGFKLQERLKRKLTQRSFWRIIYKQRYPDAPEIKHEDILIFRRC